MSVFMLGLYNVHILDLCTPQNIWHKYQDRIENVWLFNPQMFGTNIRIENVWFYRPPRMGFIHHLEICFHPQNFGMNIRIELKMFFSSPIPEICLHPPNVWYEYEDRIEGVGVHTHPRNRCLQTTAVFLSSTIATDYDGTTSVCTVQWSSTQRMHSMYCNVYFRHCKEKYVSVMVFCNPCLSYWRS